MTFKLATRVVEVTVSGAVPVVTFEVSVLATTAPAVFKLPALALPVTASELSVPTEVMLGWAAVVTVPAVVAAVALATVPVTLAPASCDRPAPLPVINPLFSVIVPLPNTAFAVALPIVSPVSVPTDVILPCALVVTEPAVVAAPVNAPTNVVDVTLDKPVTVVVVVPSARVVLPKITFEFASLACARVPLEILLAFNAVSAEPLPVKIPVFAVNAAAVTVPLTPSDVNVPTDVIFGCAFVVTVPAVVAAPDNAPTNVVAVIELFDRLAVRPVLVSSVTLPVAAFANMRKLFPVPAATLIKSATFA